MMSADEPQQTNNMLLSSSKKPLRETKTLDADVTPLATPTPIQLFYGFNSTNM